jgi:hypothetical protein
MDDLNILLKFINTNNTFSDFDLIQNYINSLNFNKLRGGSINEIINENSENENSKSINENSKNINENSKNDNENSENINNKYMINEGTILFHASKNKSINTNKIKVGDVNLYAYFTNNLNTATNTIKLFNLNEKYIHVFKTKKNINNLVFDMSNYNENKSISKIQYGGICFKYPNENRIQRVKNNLMINNKRCTIEVSHLMPYPP